MGYSGKRYLSGRNAETKQEGAKARLFFVKESIHPEIQPLFEMI